MSYNSVADNMSHSFSHCWLPNLRNHAKFRENSNLQQLYVIQDHWTQKCHSKVHMWLLSH